MASKHSATRTRGGSVFECSVCRRKYGKKEHLQVSRLRLTDHQDTGAKPFKCSICHRGFSRADVLTRHVRGHRGREPAESTGAVQQSIPSHHADVITAVSSASLVAEGLSSDDRYLPIDDHSSLLWPDTQSFFQSLTSLDSTAWDQVAAPLAEAPASTSILNEIIAHVRLQNAPGSEDAPPSDEHQNAQDGHRAVQTVNGLISNTFSSVTAPPELAELTPRFLDSSLHMFFTKFIPIFPVIHRSTFVFRDCSAPLLLNAIALGSLFLRSEQATAKGEALWRLAYTAIATSWPVMISQKREHDPCSGVQLVLTSLLSQTYAALSQNRILRMTSQTFYGLSMHWAQYCGIYDIPAMPRVPFEDSPEEVKALAWKAWVARETQLRALLGLCIIDGVVSQFSGNPVNTWLPTNSLPLPADEDAFNADCADKWIRQMTRNGRHRVSTLRFCDLCHTLFDPAATSPSIIPSSVMLFDIRIILEILNALAAEARRSELPPVVIPSLPQIHIALRTMRHHILYSDHLSPTDRSIGLLRFHAVCLDLNSTARGTRRMCDQLGIPQGIFGGEKRLESAVDPARWVQSLAGRKGLLHALQIQLVASQMPLGLAHDVYLPGALFAAASTYGSFALAGISKVRLPGVVDWDVVLGLEEEMGKVDSRTRDFLEGKLGRMAGERDCEMRNLLYELSSLRILLGSLSIQWGVTREMEEVIEAWELRCDLQ
ncbi:hypothetical protein N7474_000215 [Penicillium riverlandense]|uniref:uncharacterized protein n=1 Tax=Penicillium riverlandense TaxID=1903569 RepID=UPI002546C8FC|nr:uncharacterized protein N7474_000215 [Penicillium riverlandense]KAJ5831904.1 hypothetical protein N7474_000215 [Penicillium riverlandense]